MALRTQRPTIPRSVGNHETRIRVLERRFGSGDALRILVGQVYNDANIIAGLGFTAEWANEDGSNPGGDTITIRFDTPFSDPPTVLITENNNNPADAEGEYAVTQKSVAVDYFEAVGREFDGTPNMGGFNFAAVETAP